METAEKELYTCDNCGKETGQITVDDCTSKEYCEDCAIGLVRECYSCGYFVSEYVYAEDTCRYFCLECDETAACIICGERNEHSYRYAGDTCNYFCIYHDETIYCDHCDRSVENYTYIDGNYYCRDCEEEACHRVRNYSYKPEPVFHKLAYENTTYLGVELEVEDSDQSNRHCENVLSELFTDKDVAYIKEDGSIDYGYEIVTHPHTVKAHKKLGWRSLLKQMKENGLVSYDGESSCGLHVHVSKSSFKGKFDTWKAAAFVYKCPNKMTKFSQRNSSQLEDWCSLDVNMQIFNPINFANEHPILTQLNSEGDLKRYYALNFKNSKTIEFRLFRGTLHFERFWSSLLFADSMVCFTANHGAAFFLRYDEEILWSAYIEFIKSRNEYKFLYDYLIKKSIV